MGYMPTLRLDNGKVFSQSRAIARYACKLGGEAAPLYPSDPEEAMAVDEVLDMADELLGKCPQVICSRTIWSHKFTLETTQGRILSRSPTNATSKDATSSRWHLYGS
jgi:glutathione S-transferase